MMEIEKLKQTLSLGENQNTEFAASCGDLDMVGKTVCGFLNTAGGYLVCGVGETGEILGVEDCERAAIDVGQTLQMGLSPKTFVSVQMQWVEGRKLLVIEVPAGIDLPYAFRDVIYLRENQTTRNADVETIRDMVLRKQVEPERWERRFSSADIDHDVDVDELHSAAVAITRLHPSFFRDIESQYAVLEDLASAKYGRLTNGGDALFARNPAIRFPQLRVRAACFTVDETSDSFRDMKSFEGPLVSVLDQVFAVVVRNTPTTAKFTASNLRRLDEPLYPSDAIREGLVNAFAHRDYSDSSGGIAVRIYPTRLEIWNSGELPPGITPRDLIRGQISVLRNPDIAHVLHLQGLMEKLGRGSILILRTCRERGLREPEWTSNKGTGVTLTFFAPEVTTEDNAEDNAEDNSAVMPEVARMLHVFDGDMSRQDLQRLLGLKHDEYFRKAYLAPAISARLVEMTLPDKPTSGRQRYRLTAKGRALVESRRK
jgi:ATP-dependent DNA helicase RecG